MTAFAIYLHDELLRGSKPDEEIPFAGHSVPYFRSVHEHLLPRLSQYRQLPLRKAPLDDYLTVHSPTYLNSLQQMARDETPDEFPWLSMECRGYEYFLDAYCYGLGGIYQAIDELKAGELERAYLFPLGGHHAFRDRGHGYCLLNPMAASVRYAQEQGFAKILIVDWDIHHGDGTQSMFEHNPTVYHISSHNMVDLYMGFQRVTRMGGTTYAESVGHCNLPILPSYFSETLLDKMEWNSRYFRPEDTLTAWRDALANLPFAPDLIYIFSGYDSHGEDCGKDVTNWTNGDYETLTRMVMDKAREFQCPILSLHGGGYKLDITVEAAMSHIEMLAQG